MKQQITLDRGAGVVAARPLLTPGYGVLLQRKIFGGEAHNAPRSEVPPIVHEVLRSPGQPLDSKTRDFMEPRFGHDFSRVRVHTDARAAESARSVNALAYAVGPDVVFEQGQYAPHRAEGRKLLAHELTHVVQQGSGLQRGPTTLPIASSNDAAESEANASAEFVVGGKNASAVQSRPLQIARQNPPAAPASPTVAIGNMRTTTGSNTGAENTCPLCPLPLGILTTSGKNRMELRGDITGHTAGSQYDFKRTKERATWKKVAGVWSQIDHVGPGADDDSHDDDESLTPVNNHIYVEDGPGFTDGTDPVGDSSATEAVYKASFIETCNVKVGTGSWSQKSNDFNWHSITWMEKVAGSWQRKAGSNEIASGSTTVGTGGPVAAVQAVPRGGLGGGGPQDTGANPGP